MANEEQLKILKQGVETWNKWREENLEVEIDLSKANLEAANLSEVDLFEANLYEAYLYDANLSEADLGKAELSRANLSGANLSNATLFSASLREADLDCANLSSAFLNKVDFRRANLCGVNFNGANLSMVKFSYALVGGTKLTKLDLSTAKGLYSIIHEKPSTIGTDTLVNSKGKIPPRFLRQCGLSPWEVELARLYDPALTPSEISDIVSVDLFQKRTRGPLFIGGIFISYSHKNFGFIEKLEKKLKEEGAAVWRDVHGLEAGRLKKQIANQIRISDILLIVLSEASVNSDWVENELEQAREREKKENRDIICPIAIDDSWKKKTKGDPLWRQIEKYHILDFSGWKTKKFNEQFKRLVSGIKKNYTIFYK